jgi:hypothetical protein
MSMSEDNLRQMIAEDEFGLLAVPPRKTTRTADDRLLEAFREISDFVEAKGREPAINAPWPAMRSSGFA